MIDLKKLDKQESNFKIILIISYLLFASFIIISLLILHFIYLETTSKKLFFKESSILAKTKSRYLQDFYTNQKNTIKALTFNKDFLSFVAFGNNLITVENLFQTVMKSNKDYMQLRFINPTGYEVLRYDRSSIG